MVFDAVDLVGVLEASFILIIGQLFRTARNSLGLRSLWHLEENNFGINIKTIFPGMGFPL